MPGQLGKNILVVGKKEAVFGVPNGPAGGTIVRLNPSAGLDLKRAVIQSGEFRRDGQRTMGRLGGKSVDGSYEVDLVVGGIDFLIDGLMRAASVAAVVLTSANFTNVTITGTNTMTFGTGSPITLGIRIGDVFKVTGSANATNNNKNYRVVNVTATTIVTPTGALANQASDATLTITRGKKWINGAVPVRASYGFEEYLQDIDDGERFDGTRVIGGSFAFDADAIVKLMMTFLGQTGTVLGAASAPYYSSPTLPTGNGLVATDGLVRLNGSDVTYMTSSKIDYQLGGSVKSVLGSLLSPDVYEGDLVVGGSFTGLRQDMTDANLFAAETEFENHILLETPTGSPTKDYISLFLPKCKYTGASAPLGSEGGQIVSLPFMTGIKDVTTGYDSATATICTSAP